MHPERIYLPTSILLSIFISLSVLIAGLPPHSL